MTVDFEAFRALLFVPADRPDRAAKAGASGADAVVVDLEDAVAPDARDEARRRLPEAVAAAGAGGATVIVRLNARGEGREEARRFAGLPVAAFMLPKVEDPATVQVMAAVLDEAGATRPGLLPLVETPRGVLAAAEVAQCDGRVVALAFGGEDFAAVMGVPPGPEELGFAARMTALSARAGGVPAFGVVGSIAAVHDEAGYEAACLGARQAGFRGALAVHPRQVAVARRVFAPTAAEVAWAEAVVEDARRAPRGGAIRGRDGGMIDPPVLTRALAVLARRDP